MGNGGKVTKKQLVIVGISILLLVVGLSGCIEINQSENGKQDGDDTSDNDFWDNNDGWDDTETITVSGIENNKTINILDKQVRLAVSGVDNIVTVTKETNLIEVIISGIDCIVKVSRTHSFSSTITGIDSEIVYYD